MPENSALEISKAAAENLVALRHRIESARDHVTAAHRNFAENTESKDLAAAPFLDRCARDLEDLAQLCRSAADQAVQAHFRQ